MCLSTSQKSQKIEDANQAHATSPNILKSSLDLPKLSARFITTWHARDSQAKDTCSLKKTGIDFYQK